MHNRILTSVLMIYFLRCIYIHNHKQQTLSRILIAQIIQCSDFRFVLGKGHLKVPNEIPVKHTGVL